MGTIVAVATNDSITIASDCLNTIEDIVHPSLNQAESCIIKFGDNFLGLNCSYAVLQAIQLTFKSLPQENLAEIHLHNSEEIKKFFAGFYEQLKIQHHLIPQQQPNVPFETLAMNALLVNRHGIFKIDSTRSVYQYKKFWAIGSAETFALGALQASHKDDSSSEALAKSALKVCGVFEGNRNKEIIVKTILVPKLKLATPKTRSEKDRLDPSPAKVLMHRGPVSIRRGKKNKRKEDESLE